MSYISPNKGHLLQFVAIIPFWILQMYFIEEWYIGLINTSLAIIILFIASSWYNKSRYYKRLYEIENAHKKTT